MSKLSPRQVRWALKRREAIALRVRGYSFPAIAQMLGYSGPGAVFNAIRHELAQARQEAVEQLRAVEHERIEKIIHSIWPTVMSNPSSPAVLDAIKVYISLSARLARLLGLDIVRREATGGGAKAAASATINLVQLGQGQAPRALKDLTDQELLALVAGGNGEGQKEDPKGQPGAEG